MYKILSKEDKEALQKKGYIFEHLLCLYSSVSDTTVLYNADFPIFINGFGEADAILYGFREQESDRHECLKGLARLPINKVNAVSPIPLDDFPEMEVRYIDWDYQINSKDFDLNMRGSEYKRIRYSMEKAEKIGYEIKISRKFTPKHIYIMSRHLSRHQFEPWDYEELLSLERFFERHNHGLLMEVYRNGNLLGFDVLDFFEDNRIMVVPLGMYLDSPYVSDFMMYSNVKFAKDNGYEWIDIGPTCGIVGLRWFKEKWLGKPRYKLYIQAMNVGSKKLSNHEFSHALALALEEYEK